MCAEQIAIGGLEDGVLSHTKCCLGAEDGVIPSSLATYSRRYFKSASNLPAIFTAKSTSFSKSSSIVHSIQNLAKEALAIQGEIDQDLDHDAASMALLAIGVQDIAVKSSPPTATIPLGHTLDGYRNRMNNKLGAHPSPLDRTKRERREVEYLTSDSPYCLDFTSGSESECSQHGEEGEDALHNPTMKKRRKTLVRSLKFHDLTSLATSRASNTCTATDMANAKFLTSCQLKLRAIAATIDSTKLLD